MKYEFKTKLKDGKTGGIVSFYWPVTWYQTSCMFGAIREKDSNAGGLAVNQAPPCSKKSTRLTARISALCGRAGLPATLVALYN